MKIVIPNFIAKVIACQSEDYFSLEVITKVLPIELTLTKPYNDFLEVTWYKLEGRFPLPHKVVSLILDMEPCQLFEDIGQSHHSTYNCNVSS